LFNQRMSKKLDFGFDEDTKTPKRHWSTYLDEPVVEMYHDVRHIKPKCNIIPDLKTAITEIIKTYHANLPVKSDKAG
jgi:hypothetical protein